MMVKNSSIAHFDRKSAPQQRIPRGCEKIHKSSALPALLMIARKRNHRNCFLPQKRQNHTKTVENVENKVHKNTRWKLCISTIFGKCRSLEEAVIDFCA